MELWGPYKIAENRWPTVLGFTLDMGVSENSSTPKSSILIGFSIINHPIWGTPIFGNTHIGTKWLFPKMVGFPQQTHGFSLLKMIILGCFGENPPFKETPI